jgi:hypothetical protein
VLRGKGKEPAIIVREPDATRQPTPQDNQLMSKHRVLGFKPQLRFEWRGQEGQSETEQPDHSVSLGDSITSSTRIISDKRNDHAIDAAVCNGRSCDHNLPGFSIALLQRFAFYFFFPDPNVGCQPAVAPFWLGAAAIVLIFSFFGFFDSRLPFCSPLAITFSSGCR